MSLTELLIVGAAVSLLIQVIKAKLGTNSIGSKLTLLVVAAIVGAGYAFLKDTSFWPVLLNVMAYASLVYALLVKEFNKTN